MKDLHSHILYGIDDGAKTLEDSINMLKEASNHGVTDIVLTSHYIKESRFAANQEKRKKIFNELKEKIQEQNIDINIYLGNEVYIDEGIPELLTEEVSTINDTNYMLIEFPLNYEYSMLDEVIFELKSNGIIPIIAHPERYICYYDNLDFFKELIKEGCILQGNIASLEKKYGKHARKMLIKLLKNDMIKLLGSDSHHPEDFKYVKGAEKSLLKILKDEKKVRELLCDNFDKVINNEKL